MTLRKPKVVGTNILNRESTMRYEIAKALTPEPRRLNEVEEALRMSLLHLDGLCEYCEKNVASDSFGDHLLPLVQDKYPSQYCNDKWNQIPSCSSCNSSKNGTHWKTWMNGKSKGNPLSKMSQENRERIIEKFERYENVMQQFCQRKVIDKDFFDAQMVLVSTCFGEVQMNVKGYMESDPLKETDFP